MCCRHGSLIFLSVFEEESYVSIYATVIFAVYVYHFLTIGRNAVGKEIYEYL